MSHKKHHSRDGAVHGQLAASLVDTLSHLNFKGFLDVDNLDEISENALREGLRKSCAMVVLLHGETWQSEWCQMEWRIAEEFGLPVCVIIDMERAYKSEELQRMKDYPSFLRFPWIEYSSIRRRDAVQEVSLFLTKHTMHASGNDDNSSAISDATANFWHPGITYLMMWGGLDMRSDDERPRWLLYWFRVVKVSTYICLFTCLWRLIYARGPAFVDYSSTTATFLLHVHLLSAPIVVRSVVRSPALNCVLDEIIRAADLSSILDLSRYLFYLAVVLVPLVVSLYISLYLPLFLSSEYVADQRSGDLKSFGFVSTALFLNGILTQAPLLICMHIMSILIKLMSIIACESAADKLHPQIAVLGLPRFLSMFRRDYKFREAWKAPTLRRSTVTLHKIPMGAGIPAKALIMSEESLVAFQEHWQCGWAIFEELNRSLWPMQNIHLIWAISCMAVPITLAVKSHMYEDFSVDRFPNAEAYVVYLNGVRMVWIWLQGPLFLIIEWSFDLVVTTRLKACVKNTNSIVCAKPAHHTFIAGLAKLHSVSCATSLRIPVTPHSFICLIFIVLASAVPWLFVRFSDTAHL